MAKMPSSGGRQDLRALLDALAADEAELRKDLQGLFEAARREEIAAMEAVRRGDEVGARHHLDAQNAHREEGAVIEAEIRVISATVHSYREALETLKENHE